MDIKLTITAAPELTELLLNITGLLSSEAFRSAPTEVGNLEQNKEAGANLEDVRARLAVLSQEGKQPQVKELLNRFGVKKLSEIEPKNYADLLKEAEKI
jgi:hypothetical protein